VVDGSGFRVSNQAMHVWDMKQRSEIENACRRFGVLKLAVFGSALRDDFGPGSDLDFLVRFARRPDVDAFTQFFGLKEALEGILGRPVDLVSLDAIRNPVFRAEVERTQAPLYEAA
jgi:uncharacterized protein